MIIGDVVGAKRRRSRHQDRRVYMNKQKSMHFPVFFLPLPSIQNLCARFMRKRRTLEKTERLRMEMHITGCRYLSIKK